MDGIKLEEYSRTILLENIVSLLYYKDVIHMKEFSKNLKTLRTKQGLSQKELADQLHVERSTVSGWETKDRVPDVEILIKLAAVLGTTVDVLLKE